MVPQSYERISAYYGSLGMEFSRWTGYVNSDALDVLSYTSPTIHLDGVIYGKEYITYGTETLPNYRSQTLHFSFTVDRANGDIVYLVIKTQVPGLPEAEDSIVFAMKEPFVDFWATRKEEILVWWEGFNDAP